MQIQFGRIPSHGLLVVGSPSHSALAPQYYLVKQAAYGQMYGTPVIPFQQDTNGNFTANLSRYVNAGSTTFTAVA